jgi:hypothetical protein
MSRCLNKATLIGYLGADPEIRTTSSGARVAQFSLGTTRRWEGRDGKPREKTQWHRVLVWDSLAATFAFVEKYLRKGARVYVEGEIDYRSYETDSRRHALDDGDQGDPTSWGRGTRVGIVTASAPGALPAGGRRARRRNPWRWRCEPPWLRRAVPRLQLVPLPRPRAG